MATATRTGTTGKPTTTPGSPLSRAPGEIRPPLSERARAWIQAHKQLTSWAVTILTLAAVLVVWQLSTKRRSEDIAMGELQSARYAFENQNLPLAASELSKVIENYSGTNAAEEGRLLLANVRLLQGQPQQAVQALKDYAPGAGTSFRAQAYELLGAAYENMGRFREAGEAYENGSAAARLDFMKAQLLSDAGRAWTNAPDTTRAIAAYQKIVKDFPKQATVTEAKVRLAELTKGSVS